MAKLSRTRMKVFLNLKTTAVLESVRFVNKGFLNQIQKKTDETETHKNKIVEKK